ncbi:superfamily I DNA/RNA helicase-like protein [Sulfobacillus acidophilus TPY]|uniref:Uncharacterized protein n=1 Tax=Sulfobacillus acidophilus (strain ATCC 700253 / DSM 10332 / NAL) TaxID=679936 RepID=G8TVK6_SULAD|nr:superfamily I DNA/RNA helicase-like protein [Sulfobacillus acidophilus TPY]AEW03645.1 hypothetical protein Sulac_0071 [Sulfobacillus acidophilus DSM 10332]
MKEQSNNRPKLRANILAVAAESVDIQTKSESKGMDYRSEQDIASHLWYWDLLELTRIWPMRFPREWAREGYLTERQKAEKDAFIRPASEHIISLWQNIPKVFQPMPITHDAPWFSQTQKPVSSSPLSSLFPEVPSVPESSSIENASLHAAENVSEILRAPADARILVTAPPGTGKTYLMLDRLESLIEQPDIGDPHRDVLVLSFTRATVSEIVRRLQDRITHGASDNLRYVNVSTFDSLVSRLLVLDIEPDKLPLGYNQRIRYFLELLEAQKIPRALQELTAVRTLFVDELQDLSGVRADLVLSLARLVLDHGGGLFFSGDPAQSIYDFDREGGLTGHQFIRRLIKLVGSDLITWRLKTYYRFHNPALEKLAKELRESFGEDGLQAPSIEVLPNLRENAPRRTFGWLIEESRKRRIAILVHNNLEVFQLAQWLREQDVRVDLKSRMTVWPAWMARLVWGISGEHVSEAHLKKLWFQRVADRATESWGDALELLRQSGTFQRGHLVLNRLGELVREHVPPLPSQEAGVFITTIHQSKGLEYDTVAILEPTGKNLSGDPEEVRKMYVAATRARHDLVLLERNSEVLGFGRKDIYRHFHRFHKDNEFLLHGLEDISVQNLWQCPNYMTRLAWEQLIKSEQERWWEEGGMNRTLSLPWSLNGGVGSPSLIELDHSVQEDLKELVNKHSLPRQGLMELPVRDLVTVARPHSGDVGGTAGLFLVPWVFGWSRVLLREG